MNTFSLDNIEVDRRIEYDIIEYVEKRICRNPCIVRNMTPTLSREYDENPQVNLQNYLTRASKGCFLYIKLVLDLIQQGHLKTKSGSLNLLPKSLSEVFMLEFNIKFPTVDSFRRVADIFSVCLATMQPLTLSEIYNAINALYVSAHWIWSDFLSL